MITPYHPILIGGAVAFLIQSALIVGLLVQRRRRHRAEAESLSRAEALDVSEARNSAILRAIPDLMFVLLRDGTYVDYHTRDPSQLFVKAEEFIGRNVTDILPPPLNWMMMDAIAAACAPGSDDPVMVEYELGMPETRYYEARLVRAGHDRVLSIVRDVTEAKQAVALNRELAGRLITAQEIERARIARDLHDEVCQELASFTTDLSYIRQTGGEVHSTDVQEILGAIEQRAAGVAETLRLLSHDLHPSVLQHVGLLAAMQAHCYEFKRHHGLAISVYAEGDVEPLHQMTQLSLFRIMQEAVRNAAVHGHARQVAVSLKQSNGRLKLSVTDDGAGFDVAAARVQGGLGLVSIEERARLAKGRVSIRSERGHGTTIEADVPFDLETGLTERSP